MRSKITCLLLIIFLSISLTVSAAEIKDISEDHWAYQSVKMLVDKGLISLYEDGTFRGKDAVSRYEMAEIVARLLENVDMGNADVSEQDLSLLKRLSTEFREELVELAARGDVFAEKLNKLEQKNIIQDEMMAEIKDQDISSLQQKLETLTKEKKALENELKELRNKLDTITESIGNVESDVGNVIDSLLKIGQLEKDLEGLNKRIVEMEKTVIPEKLDNLTAKINKLEKELNSTNNRLNEQEKKFKNLEVEIGDSVIQRIEDQQTVTVTRVNALQEEVNELKKELRDSQKQVEELNKENTTYRNYLYMIGGVSILSLLIGFGG